MIMENWGRVGNVLFKYHFNLLFYFPYISRGRPVSSKTNILESKGVTWAVPRGNWESQIVWVCGCILKRLSLK